MKNYLPLEQHKLLAADMQPSLRWDGTSSLETLREKSYAKLWELLGMDKMQSCEPEMEITAEDEIHGHRHIHFTVRTEPDYYAHCDLLLPQTMPEGKLPLCVCLQGHSTGAHISLGMPKYPGDEETISGGDRDFCLRAIEEGYAALAIDQRAFGQNGGTEKGPDCTRPVLTALLLGRTVIGERVWDIMRVLDAMEANFADTITLDSSVLMGNSGGGTTTYYAACLEHRFAGFMPSCAVCTYRDSIVAVHHCPCNYVPRIAAYFDMGDLALLIAPKKLVIVCGKDDPIFPLHGVNETFDIVKRLYAGVDAADNCALVVGYAGHRFYANEAWPVMKALLAK